MKHLLLALTGLFAVSMIGCSLLSGTPTISYGEVTSGTITESDTDFEGLKSKVYTVDVRKGVEYFIRLAHDDNGTVSLWTKDSEESLVEVNAEVPAHTAAYKFPETGAQELYVRSPGTILPANYTLKFWTAGGS